MPKIGALLVGLGPKTHVWGVLTGLRTCHSLSPWPCSMRFCATLYRSMGCLFPCAGSTPPACLRARAFARTFRVRQGPTSAHVRPLIRAWAAPPTRDIAGVRMRRSVFSPAMRVFVRSTHHSMHRFRQSADPFSQNRPFSAFFTQWVCTLATTPPQVVASPPPNGGIAPLGVRHADDRPTASS